MHLLLTFLFFLFLLVVGGLLVAMRLLGGVASRMRRRDPSDSGKGAQRHSVFSHPKAKKKVFGKDEGEYVDFEEIPPPTQPPTP